MLLLLPCTSPAQTTVKLQDLTARTTFTGDAIFPIRRPTELMGYITGTNLAAGLAPLMLPSYTGNNGKPLILQAGALAWAGPSYLGTVTTGVWNATPIGAAYGGTGQVSLQASLNALAAASGALVQGDLLYYNGTNVVKLAAGTSGQKLRTNGSAANPSWTEGTGYVTGDGGTVTQATNRSTGVTINTRCGQITMNNASLAAGANVTFTVSNTNVVATDCIIANLATTGTGTPSIHVVSIGAGTFNLMLRNNHASTADTTADVINFAILKAVNN